MGKVVRAHRQGRFSPGLDDITDKDIWIRTMIRIGEPVEMKCEITMRIAPKDVVEAYHSRRRMAAVVTILRERGR